MTVGAQSSEAMPRRANPGWIGRALVVVLGVSVALSWMTIQAMFVFTQAVWLAAAGQVFAGAEPGRIADQIGTLRLVLAGVLLGAAILFVGWIHRAHETLAALGGTGAGSARDSVRACLIPGVNLVRIPSMVASLWRASGADRPPASVSTWVAWWWALCLATAALDLSAAGWLGPEGALSLRVLAECARIAAAVLTIVIVTRIERLLRERSAASTPTAGTVAGA
jgi:hypothetical protein